MSIQQVNTPQGRYYLHEDGTKLVSVTSLLSHFKSDEITKWEEAVGVEEATRVKNVATFKGTQFHDIAEKYLKSGEIPDFGTNLLLKDRFQRARSTLDRITDIRLQEQILFSKKLRMAGTVDCVGLYDNTLSIIDFKTSSEKKEEYRLRQYYLQGTAYFLMYTEMYNEKPEQVVILSFPENDRETQINIIKPQEYIKELLSMRNQYYLDKPEFL